MSHKPSIAFIGDTHGHNELAVKRVLSLSTPPTTALHVGDFDADSPLPSLYQGLVKAGIDFWWVHGNHDVDREYWYDNTLGSAWSSRCLHARVIDHRGVKIAGLGGHFVEKVWHPEMGAPRFASRKDYLASCGKGNRWRGGLPRKVRGAIWWEDVDRLWDQTADILITHEAPTPHRYGHSVIAELAEAMGASLIVHGHMHESYDAMTPGGIAVIGLGLSEVRSVQICTDGIDVQLLAEDRIRQP